jgi:hypothetical protein
LAHIEELVSVITDPPSSHSDHVDESDESDPAPSNVALTVHRWIDVRDINLFLSIPKRMQVGETHVYTTAYMDGTGYDDEPRTPSMKHIQTLVRKSRQLGEDVILSSQPYHQRYVGVCQSSSVMSLPVDIAIGPEEDEEEVEKGVAGDEGDLADVAKVEPVGYLKISNVVKCRNNQTHTDALDAVLSPKCVQEGKGESGDQYTMLYRCELYGTHLIDI